MSKLLTNIVKYALQERRYFSPALKLSHNKKGSIVISCKRKEYDHYTSYAYNSLDEVPLASKGWTHSKSKGDFFTVHPVLDDIDEPTYSFKQLEIHPDLINALKAEEILNATEFQVRAINAIRTGILYRVITNSIENRLLYIL